MGKKVVKASKDASWARLPRLDAISVFQVQFFDNRSKATGVKGQSDFALKLFAWTAGWDIDLKKAEWWRVVQLIEPKTVLKWTKEKLAAGDMTAEMFETYSTVASQAVEMAEREDVEIVKMGHIASPPGKQYFIGQFVFLVQFKGGKFSGFVYNDGDTIELDDMTPTRKAGKYRKPGTPTHAAILKGHSILEAQRKAQADLEAYRAGPPVAPVADNANELLDVQARAFVAGSPF